MNVLFAKAALTDDWTDLASLCGSNGGPTRINGWWDGVAFDRDAVTVAGEDRTRRTENTRGVGRKWLPEFLIVAETPAAADALLDEFKRFIPVGSVMYFKLNDADKFRIGAVDAIRPVDVMLANRTDEWTHGDRRFVVEVTFNDGAAYDEDDGETSVLANTAVAIPVGSRPHPFVFVTAGSYTGITLEAYADNGGSPAATPYASLALSTATAGNALTIDTDEQTAILAGAPATHRWGDITAGWFFKLGQEGVSGQTQVWLKSTRAGTYTGPRRWG